MKTLIINGSPRAAQGNTEVFIRQFLSGAGQEYPVRYVAKETPDDLVPAVAVAETLLVFMPLFVHAMPGIVMKLFERMPPATEGQRIGFVVQAGFPEGAQARFLVRYLNAFADRLGYENLGIVTRGDAAATSMVPAFMAKKLFGYLRKLGSRYALDGQFDQETMALLAGLYEIPLRTARLYEFLHRSGLNHIVWHKFWRDNGVRKQGLDRPFSAI